MVRFMLLLAPLTKKMKGCVGCDISKPVVGVVLQIHGIVRRQFKRDVIKMEFWLCQLTSVKCFSKGYRFVPDFKSC